MVGTSLTLHATIGILGAVYHEDGSLAVRFSDFACCSADMPTFASAYQAFGPLDQSDPSANVADRVGADFDRRLLPNQYEARLQLRPGTYRLMVVLSDDYNFGRATTALTIENYDAKGLALSSVLLCKRYRDAHVAAMEAAAANFAPQYVPLVSKGIQVTPTGDTRFKKGEPLIPYFEIYEPLLVGPPSKPGDATPSRPGVIPAQAGIQSPHENPSTPVTVQAHIRILDAKTGEVKKDFAPIDAASYERPGSWVIPIAREIPYDQLPKGAYRLEVQATDSAGRTTPWRTASFSVE